MKKYIKGVCVDGLEYLKNGEWKTFAQGVYPIDAFNKDLTMRVNAWKKDETFTWGELISVLDNASIVPVEYVGGDGWEIVQGYCSVDGKIYDGVGEPQEFEYIK